MLRPQLACTILFILAVASHAITPIHPLPEKSDAGKIEIAKHQIPGHITSIPAPVAVVAAEPSTLSPFDSFFADTIAAMQQKAEAAKIKFAPEIEKLKEKGQVAKQELQALQAQAALKFQPELDKLSAEESKLRAAAAAEVEKRMPTQQQLDELRQKADAAASAIGREFNSMKVSVNPYVAQMKESVSKVARDISKSPEDASNVPSKQIPDRIESAEKSVAVAEQALQEDLKAEFDKLKPVAASIGKEIEANKESFADFLHKQQEHFENDHNEIKPWDAVESEVRSDMENIGRLFSDRLQSAQSPLGVQPPLRGGARVMIISRKFPGSDDHNSLDPQPEHDSPFMPPFLMPHGPVGGVQAFRIRLGVPIVGPGPLIPDQAPEQKAGGGMEHDEKEEHGGRGHHHGHHGHGHGGKFHHLKHWLRTHFSMNRPENMQAADESQPQRGLVIQLHSGLDGQQAESEGSDEDAMGPDSFHDDHHHDRFHGKRFARCLFGIVMPIIFVVAFGLLMRRCVRCCNGRQRSADVRVVGGVVMRGQQQQQQQQQQPYFHINHPAYHQYQHPQQQQSFYPPPPPPHFHHQAHAAAPPNPYSENSWAAVRSAAPPPPPRVVGATFPHFPSVFGGATAPPQGDGIEMRTLH
jgi:chemotaxis protein histidine kinase CheA